jgi:hypothetical protein
MEALLSVLLVRACHPLCHTQTPSPPEMQVITRRPRDKLRCFVKI